jgi:hypothetical protein
MADQVEEEHPRSATFMAAPHGARLVAFGLDIVVVLAVALVAGGGWLRFLGVLLAYHTALVWLTGQTIGKAVANLAVRRVDGRTYMRTPRGLLWALGRASVGYLLVDVLGLGILVALPRRNVARRCLHDWVFGSQVVLRGELEWALPKMRRRLSEFARSREDASKQVAEKQEEPRRLSNLWQWLVTGALGLEKILDVVQLVVTRVSHWFGGAGEAHAGTTTLSTKTAAGVAVGSAAASVVTVAALAMLAEPPAVATVEGDWGIAVVEETGPDSYVGRSLKDISKKQTGCVWKAGRQIWRLDGTGPNFDGEVLWGQGARGHCSGFHWRSATFEFHDKGTPSDPSDDTLRYCSTGNSGREQCSKNSRG